MGFNNFFLKNSRQIDGVGREDVFTVKLLFYFFLFLFKFFLVFDKQIFSIKTWKFVDLPPSSPNFFFYISHSLEQQFRRCLDFLSFVSSMVCCRLFPCLWLECLFTLLLHFLVFCSLASLIWPVPFKFVPFCHALPLFFISLLLPSLLVFLSFFQDHLSFEFSFFYNYFIVLSRPFLSLKKKKKPFLVFRTFSALYYPFEECWNFLLLSFSLRRPPLCFLSLLPKVKFSFRIYFIYCLFGS